MTDVLVTTWTSDGVPHTWSGSPQSGETNEEFIDRFIDELEKVFGVLPPDKGTEVRTAWETNGVCLETRGPDETEQDFINRYIDALFEALEANPPSGT